MKSRKFGKLIAILLCLVLLAGQNGISLGATEGPEYEGMPTEKEKVSEKETSGGKSAEEKSTAKKSAEKESGSEKKTASEEELTPTPKPTGEAEESLTPTPKVTGTAEEQLTPTPEATGEAEKQLTPTPKVTGETEKQLTPTPKVTGEAEKQLTPTPKVTGEAEKQLTPIPDTAGSSKPENQTGENTNSPDKNDSSNGSAGNPAMNGSQPSDELPQGNEPQGNEPQENGPQENGSQENGPQENGSQENGPQAEESENDGTGSSDQPEADMGEDPAGTNAETSPVPEKVGVSSLNYREKGAPFQGAGNHVIYFSLDSTSANAKDYNYEFTGESFQESIPGSNITLSVASSRTGWFALTKSFSQGGTYTLTVKNAAMQEVGSRTIDIYKVTFDPQPGQFSNGSSSPYTGYGMADTAWNYYNTPPTPVSSSGAAEYIGWSETKDANNYEALTYTAGGARDRTGYDVTLYAAYGQKKVYALEAQDSQGSSITDGKLTVNIDSEKPEPVILKLKNTGNQTLFLTSRIGTSDYDVTLDAHQNGLKAGGTLSLTLTPRAMSKGTHQGFVWIYGAEKASGSVRTTLTLIVTTNVTAANTVKVIPGSLTKCYGETKSASDVTVTFEPDNFTLKDLGVTLRSNGFAADANVGTYGYSLSGGSDKYDIKLDSSGEVTVTQAEPESSVNVQAANVHEGATLADSSLSGTFVNHFTRNPVTGNLTWAEDTSTVLNSTGNHKWIFTPTGQDEKNYTTVEGETEVQVSERKPTTLSVTGQTEFTYDGNPHGLTFAASRVGAVSVQYQINSEWSDEPPVYPGTYAVKASIGAAGEFSAATCDANLTITPRIIAVHYSAIGKPYDGTREVKTQNINVSIYNKVPGDDVGVTATASYDSKDAGSRNVAITLGELTGTDAGNYQLPAKVTYHTTAMISPVVIQLKPAEFTKEYGAVKLLTGADFDVTGLINGETAPLEFTCSGTEAEAAAGSYPVTAVLRSGGNYTFKSGVPGTQTAEAGTLTVVRAEPVPSMSGIHAGQGKRGGKLENVTLNGLFVNPHNDTMNVPGTLAWSSPGTILPNEDTFEAEWIFTPSDTQNYTDSVTGKVTVTLEALQPFNVTVHSKVVTYNGEAQKIEPEISDSEKEMADVVVEYRHRKDIAARIAIPANSDIHDDYVTQPPADAGFYDVHVHVYVKDQYRDKYADNLEQATLEIVPASPETEAQTVAVSQDTPLTGSLNGLVKMPADIKGQELKGQLIWDAEGTLITAEGDYSWTFLPDDPNYTQVHGSTRITLAKDSRVISAVVYNLPNALNYSDYAVVDIEKSGLKAGDIVTFYEDAGCTDPESSSVNVTENTGTLRVTLDDDALADSDGIIYARITSSIMHQVNEIKYLPELGLTIPDSVTTRVGESAELSAAVTDASYSPASISITANEGDIITVENDSSQNALVKGVRAGSTIIQVMAVFEHPDTVYAAGQTITITGTVRVLVEEVTGSLVITKTVIINDGETKPDDAFTFSISLTRSDGTPLEGETTYGGVTFTGGTASIELKDGESKTISGIPGGTKYTVTEDVYEDYTSAQENAAGAITPGSPVTASFTNTKKAVPTPTPTASPEPSASPVPTVSPEPSASPVPTVSPTPTVSPEPSASPVPTVSPTPTVSPEPTGSPEPTASPEPTVSPEPTASPEPTVSQEPTASPEPTVSPEPTLSPVLTVSPEPTGSPEPTVSPVPTVSPEPTASPEPTVSPEPTASPEPTVSPEPTLSPEPNVQTKVTQTEGLGNMDIPEELKNNGLDNPETITEELKRTVISGGHTGSEEDIAFYNVEMQISTDGGANWTPATKDNFPAGGLVLTIPYPVETDASYVFTVTHMFTHTMNGYRAGEVEICNTANTDEGIQFVVHGLSPIAVAWAEPTVTPELSVTPDPTEIPELSGTPEPTVTPELSGTPEPTEIPELSGTPEPTEIPELSGTPELTVTPEATPSVTPEETPGITPTPEETPAVTPSETPAVTPTATPAITPSKAPTAAPTKAPGITPSTTPVARQTDTPKTADDTPIGFWTALLFLAGCEILLLVFKRYRDR